jgi:hypothetical protein
MRIFPELVALAIIVSTSAHACEHTVVLSNWKSCAVGPLGQNGGETDWLAVPAWTKDPAIRPYFYDNPRLLALRGLCKMNDPAELASALRANCALIVEAQRLRTGYLAKQTEAPELVDSLLKLLDGPQQREAQRLAREALGD